MPLPDLRLRTFALPALAAEVSLWCAALPHRATDDRVAPTADERTLRYYQSIALLDRPLRYEGRLAIYGYRHLLQALAAKVLQAQGFSLAQVQRALAGATDELLESSVLEALEGAEPRGAAAPPPPEPRAGSAPRPDPPRAGVPVPWPTFGVAAGVVVSIDPSVHPDPEAVARLVAAALLSALTPPGARP